MTLRYSQKTGDLKGDATVWNTAKDGSGADLVPVIGDWGIVQTGHVITQQDHGFFPHMMVEVGGTFDQNGKNLLRYGSFIKNGTYISGGGLTRIRDDGIIRGMSEDEPFAALEICPGLNTTGGDYTKVTNEGTSKLHCMAGLKAEGNLTSQDHGVNTTPAATSRISVPDHANFRPEFEEAFSIFTRVRFDSIPALVEQHLVHHMDAVTDTDGYKIVYDPADDKLKFITERIGTEVEASYLWTPTIGVTYNIVATRKDNGILYLYIDHDLVATSSTFDTGVLGSTENFIIGGDYSLGHPLEGVTYETRYWDGYQLTQSDISGLLEGVTPGTAPEMNLQMNEGTGATVEDSQNSHDGTIENSATWEDPFEWRVFGTFVMSPTSTVIISSGEADVILYHGDLTVHAEHIAVYTKRAGGTGTVSGLVRSSSYHTTVETYTIDADALVDDNIAGVEIQRNINKSAQCDVSLECTPKVRDYILGTDKIEIEYEGETLFQGIVRERKVSHDVAVLTALDALYDLRKQQTQRTIHGTLIQWWVAVVDRANKHIALAGNSKWVSDFFFPVIDIVYLNTLAKQLDDSLSGTLSKRVGAADPGTMQEEYVSQPFSSRGGDILRIAAHLYNGGEMSAQDILKWAIWDLDASSPNYDTEIATGTLDTSAIAPGEGAWVVFDVITALGRIKCPNRCKLILGGEAATHFGGNTNYMEWTATYISVNHQDSAKELVTTTGQSPTEANLTQININDDVGERSGIQMCHEIETENDWWVKKKPEMFDYSGHDVGHIKWGNTTIAPPSFANETRKKTSTEWEIARVSAWLDGNTIDDFIKQMVNEWGRYWIDKITVDVENTQEAPYILIEGSVGDALNRLIEAWGGEYWLDPSTNDEFVAAGIKAISDWSSYSADEKTERTILFSPDATGWDNIDKYRIGRLVSESYTETSKYLSRQIVYDQDQNLSPILTDYSESEPFLPEVSDQSGSISGLFGLGSDVLDEKTETLKDVKMNIVDIALTAGNVLKNTNNLIKAVDSRNGLSNILILSGLGQRYGGGGWTQKVDMTNVSTYKSALETLWWAPFFKPYRTYDLDQLPTIGDINLSSDFIHSLEVNDLTYSDGDDDYWILLGGDNTGPTTKTMQESDASQQLICLAERVLQGAYGYVVALFTEQNLLGEWDDVFDIKEVGLYKGSSKPAYGATLDARKVLEVPGVGDEGYASALTTAGALYRSPVKFLRNSQFTVTFGHTSSGS